MNTQRKVVITTTYNEMGIIIDTKAEEVAQPNTTTHDSIPAETGKNDSDGTSGDCISRQRSVDTLRKMQTYKLFAGDDMILVDKAEVQTELMMLPSAKPERPRGHWVEIGDEPYDEWECDVCGFAIDGSGCIDPEEYRDVYKFCPNCGADMRPTERRTDG